MKKVMSVLALCGLLALPAVPHLRRSGSLLTSAPPTP